MIVALAALVVVAGWFWLRLRALGRRVGSFPCAIRTPSGWTSGIACYGAADLRWYRVVSLSPRPRYVWDRSVFAILAPAHPVDSGEGPGVGAQRGPGGRGRLVQVECRVEPGPDGVVSLAVSSGTYAGLASWLESAPPGAGLPRTLL
ncbi:DUF2550 family protein [Salana multivorans]